jgi:oligopeptide/dipeptide ABC transporter ATP-binding protein
VFKETTPESWTRERLDVSLADKPLFAMSSLLIVDDLRVRFSEPAARVVTALNGVSMRLPEGQVLGLLGESGSGKSTLAKTLLRMLPNHSQVSGDVEFEGRSLLELKERDMNQIRGARIAMISQEPGLALNPVMKVGDQIAEVLRAHRAWDGLRRRSEAESLLEQVNLSSAERRVYDAYPHQLSGGQQQRVVIAQALACGPSLIIADEPTASLDSDTENEILELFRQLKVARKTSLILITHDPAILPGLADRVAVLYAGRIVEDAPCERILQKPMHPYTKALLACVPPAIADRPSGYRLTTIAGSPPRGVGSVPGCSFSPRCSERIPKCQNLRPFAQEMEEERRVECFLYED